jgi:CRISPR-associated protein Cmr4
VVIVFQAASLLFITVETPLHAGTARGLGAVDLPIQRERTTDYPIVQASGLKGRLRAATDPGNGANGVKAGHLAVFGPETGSADAYAGALSVCDARLLLFPVRSLAGVFAWTTSDDALARFRREAALARVTPDWPEVTAPAAGTALVHGDALQAGGSVVLEEFSFTPEPSDAVRQIGAWLAANALPTGDEYAYWRESLPRKLCVLHEDAFRDFVRYGTEVQTHVKLDAATKTVTRGMLWTSESLPVDTMLYAPLLATASRDRTTALSAEDVLGWVADRLPPRTQLGGDETTGQGIVALRFMKGAAS